MALAIKQRQFQSCGLASIAADERIDPSQTIKLLFINLMAMQRKKKHIQTELIYAVYVHIMHILRNLDFSYLLFFCCVLRSSSSLIRCSGMFFFSSTSCVFMLLFKQSENHCIILITRATERMMRQNIHRKEMWNEPDHNQ